jgi:hypothetical protein
LAPLRDLTRPYEFAVRNYARYPAFSIPYHPGVSGLLGLFFVVTGVSYGSARLFVGLCLGVAAAPSSRS